jgi:hypothetical protein
VVCPRGYGMGSCGEDAVAMCLTTVDCGYKLDGCDARFGEGEPGEPQEPRP